MKFVSVTRSGNESDIIEAFVRHHAQLFDLMLIIDDDSTDGTAAILANLRAEGLQLETFRASEVAWPQPDFVLELMRLAFTHHAADWVAMLDADEFVELPADITLHGLLPESSEYVFQLRWSNFVWTRDLAGMHGNPVEIMSRRLAPRADSSKIMVPRNLYVRDPAMTISAGNHGIISKGDRLLLFYFGEVELCHYPIRSIEQFTSKCVINYLRYLEVPPENFAVGWQYREPVETIKRGCGSLNDLMERASLHYAPLRGFDTSREVATRPLRYLGGALKYSNYKVGALANIVQHAETLARRIADRGRPR